MIWVFLYLCLGLANYGQFAARGGAFLAGANWWPGFVLEFLFFVLLWPVQLLFQIVVGVGNFFTWLGEKVMS